MCLSVPALRGPYGQARAQDHSATESIKSPLLDELTVPKGHLGHTRGACFSAEPMVEHFSLNTDTGALSGQCGTHPGLLALAEPVGSLACPRGMLLGMVTKTGLLCSHQARAFSAHLCVRKPRLVSFAEKRGNVSDISKGSGAAC